MVKIWSRARYRVPVKQPAGEQGTHRGQALHPAVRGVGGARHLLAQAYALVRSGELPAIKVGGRGQWRVEVAELESYIQRMYTETKTFVAAHPFGQAD